MDAHPFDQFQPAVHHLVELKLLYYYTVLSLTALIKLVKEMIHESPVLI